MNEREAREAAATKLTAELFDQGKIIEGGWQGLRVLWLHPDSPSGQVETLRCAFFAGAKHLYDSILNVLDPGDDLTERDLARMGKIDAELRAFGHEFALRHLPTKGQG